MASNAHATNGSAAAHDSDYVVPLWINGEERRSSIPAHPVQDPSTKKPCWHFSPAGLSEANESAKAAQTAWKSWSKTKPGQRRDIILKAADILEQRTDEYGRYMEIETGSLPDFAGGFNLPLAIQHMRDTAGRITAALGGTINICDQPNRHAMVLKEPYGVTLGIAPWNAPYILGQRSFVAALAAGNTCIVKGSENSPRCYWAMGQAFQEAGLPPGCLNILTVRPEDAIAVTTALIENPIIKHVNFTGSTNTGASIAGVAGKNLKPCLMELGGKNCAIVCDDADVDEAAKWCAIGSFLHSGQICMCTDLVMVHKSIATPFTEALRKWTTQLHPEDGPASVLVAAAGVSKNQNLLKDALTHGAHVLHGKPGAEEQTDTRMRPVIIENINPKMDMWRVEAFGPTVGLVHVDSDEEALEIANGTDHGLAGAVFTKDLARGFRVSRELESGAVHINCMTVHDESNLPHGGIKRSGWGRFNASAGMDEFMRTKTLTWQE